MKTHDLQNSTHPSDPYKNPGINHFSNCSPANDLLMGVAASLFGVATHLLYFLLEVNGTCSP